MGQETERKYLVKTRSFQDEAFKKEAVKQGYLSMDPEKTIRIRTKDGAGYITIKGKTTGFSRMEYEYAIPYGDAVEMLKHFCDTTIEKVRYYINYQHFLWEVDVFEGDNEGLVMAEIELPDEKTTFEKPEWIGKEVTGNPAYYNAMLVQHPYRQWIKKG